MWVHPQAVQRQGQGAIVALAGAADNQFGQHRRDPQLGRWIVDAAGRHQEVQGGAADVLHVLREQGETVGQRVLMDFLRQGLVLAVGFRRSIEYVGRSAGRGVVPSPL
jgi:hypothetical protein